MNRSLCHSTPCLLGEWDKKRNKCRCLRELEDYGAFQVHQCLRYYEIKEEAYLLLFGRVESFVVSMDISR